MGRRALDSFEDRGDGSWVCTHATTVAGPSVTVPVRQGQSFAPGTVFAGYDDFTAYLARVSVESPAKGRHEW
jgi:hypothetical protein